MDVNEAIRGREARSRKGHVSGVADLASRDVLFYEWAEGRPKRAL